MLVKRISIMSFSLLLVAHLSQAAGPPILVEEPVDTERTAFVNDSIKLTCKFRRPSPYIQWYHNGEYLRSSLRVRLNRRGTLKITNVRLSDAGSYTCKGTNGYGSVTVVYNLEVKAHHDVLAKCHDDPEKGEPIWTKQKDDTMALAKPEGHDIEIDCDARGSPRPNITWYKNGQEIRFVTGKYSKDGLKLKIIDLEVNDQGNYTCVVQNECGAIAWTYSLRVIQRIMVAPIIDNIDNQTVIEGQDVVFTCKILVSDSQPFLQWLRHYKVNGSYVDENDEPYVHKLQQSGILKTIDDPQYLKIANATEEDEGWYTCLVANSVGMNYRTAWLTVLKNQPEISTEKPEESLRAPNGIDKNKASQKIEEIKEKLAELEEIIN